LVERQPHTRHSSGYLEGLARLVEQLPAVVWTTDHALRVTSASGRALEQLGLPADQVHGKTLFEWFHTDDAQFAAIEAHARALKGEEVACEYEYDGRTFTTQVVPLRDEHGDIQGCIGLGVDLGDVRRAEAAVRRSEAHYRALVEDAPVGIFRSSSAGRFLTVNAALMRMLGYESEEEMLGLDLAADVYLDPQLREQLVSHYQQLEHVSGVDVEWRRKDGARILVRLSGQPVRDAQGNVEAWEMVAEDVTERRRLEAQLRTAQKMEALGLVTGGVAHDFNNLLTSILANSELIISALPPSMAEIRSDMLEIQDAAVRGGDLVKKLLGFSRRERLTMQPTETGAVVQEMGEVLRRLLPSRINVHVNVEADLPPVLADAGALQQILLNLATNSRDAIVGNGELRLVAERVTLDTAHVNEFGWGLPGPYVAVRVRDNGLGMDEATRARVFEPFFTTKPPGAGSGLGLAMVYGLMKQMNGFVGVTSAPGTGTTVTLFVPITGRKTPVPSAAEPQRRRGDIVLVVEDEEPIRRVARRVLERHGYVVLTAADGVEALNLFREHEADVALILTDVVMPRMGGKVLHQTLRDEGKQVPVVFMSGYAARGDTPETAQIDPGMVVLAKPWSVEQLLERVKAAIGTADG